MNAPQFAHAEPDVEGLVLPDRVSRRLYLEREIFELEMKRIFGRAWLYLAHESQIPREGDYVAAWMGL